MKQILIVTAIVMLALSTVQTTTYADFPPTFILTMDHLNRIILDDNNRDSIYTFKCPTFSDKDEFTIDMSEAPTLKPNMANDYFENYERIACSDKTPMELMEDLNTEMEDLTQQLKEWYPSNNN